MPIQGLGSTVSAIKAFGTKMHSIADNIANSQSVEHKKGRVLLLENDNNQGVKVNFTRIDTPGYLSLEGEELSNVDLAEEFSSMIITQNGFDANVKMARTVDEMTGTLIDIAE
jgi:flagellar hook protein FlgE